LGENSDPTGEDACALFRKLSIYRQNSLMRHEKAAEIAGKNGDNPWKNLS